MLFGKGRSNSWSEICLSAIFLSYFYLVSFSVRRVVLRSGRRHQPSCRWYFLLSVTLFPVYVPYVLWAGLRGVQGFSWGGFRCWDGSDRTSWTGLSADITANSQIQPERRSFGTPNSVLDRTSSYHHIAICYARDFFLDVWAKLSDLKHRPIEAFWESPTLYSKIVFIFRYLSRSKLCRGA